MCLGSGKSLVSCALSLKVFYAEAARGTWMKSRYYFSKQKR